MVVEVGLGGTWDCTNVVHGDVAVLTNVSYDHTDVLGPTLEGIAADKAGIIEPGSTVVIGRPAARTWWPSSRHGRPRSGRPRSGSPGRTSVSRPTRWRSVAGWSRCGRPAAATTTCWSRCTGHTRASTPPCALAAVEAFFGEPADARGGGGGLRRRSACPAGSRCSAAARCCSSTARTTWPAWRRSATRSTEEFAVDGDQGGGGRHALGPRSLGHAGAAGPGRRVDRGGLCQPDSPRAMPGRVAEAARSLGLAVHVEPDVRDALRLARAMVDADGLVVVAGSLYVVGAAPRRRRCRPPCRGRKPAADRERPPRLCNLDSSWTAPLSL